MCDGDAGDTKSERSHAHAAITAAHHDNQYTESFRPMILRPCLSLRSFSVTILYRRKINCSGWEWGGRAGAGKGRVEVHRCSPAPSPLQCGGDSSPEWLYHSTGRGRHCCSGGRERKQALVTHVGQHALGIEQQTHTHTHACTHARTYTCTHTCKILSNTRTHTPAWSPWTASGIQLGSPWSPPRGQRSCCSSSPCTAT